MFSRTGFSTTCNRRSEGIDVGNFGCLLITASAVMALYLVLAFRNKSAC
jgi:hypothetical protein